MAEINKEIAMGFHLTGDDWEYIKAVKRPDTNCKITQQIWFKGKAKHFKKRMTQ